MCGMVVLLALAGVAWADQPPPHGQQLTYDPATGRFVEEAEPVAGTPLGDLQLARQALARGEHRRADAAAKKWIKTYGEGHELGAEARLLRAEIDIARRDHYKAHKRLDALLGEFGGGDIADRAATLEFVVAEVFLSGTKRKVWGIPLLNARDKGIEILDRLSTDFDGTTLAENAIKTKADHYFDRGEFALAELEYARLTQEYPRSRYVRPSMRRSAESALASFPGIDFDDAALIEAEERFRQYLAQYADAEQEGVGQILEQIHATRAEKELSIGRYYEKTKHRESAIFYYRSTCRNWPDTAAAFQARDRLTRLGAGGVDEAAATSFEAEVGP